GGLERRKRILRSLAAKQRRVALRAPHRLANRGGIGIRAQPAQAAAPLDQRAAVQSERRRGRGHRDAPESAVACKERMLMLAYFSPEAVSLAEKLSADRLRSTAHRAFGAREPHRELAALPCRRADRQRLAGPAIERSERLRL